MPRFLFKIFDFSNNFHCWDEKKSVTRDNNTKKEYGFLKEEFHDLLQQCFTCKEKKSDLRIERKVFRKKYKEKKTKLFHYRTDS